MLTKVEAENINGDILELILTNLAKNETVHLREIPAGLDPVKADINTAPYGAGDGETYVGSVIGRRNIVMRLGLNPDWVLTTMTSLRQMLYGYFTPRQWVKLRFFHDEDSEFPTTEIEGYVESFELNMFSQDPEAQISIICPQPDFLAIESEILTGLVTHGVTTIPINYAGTVPTGFELRVEKTDDNPSFISTLTILTQSDEFGLATLEIGVQIDAAQYFHMGTNIGRKFVHHVAIPGGEITNIMGNLIPLSKWPRISPGLNYFSVSTILGDVGQEWTMEYVPRFGGL